MQLYLESAEHIPDGVNCKKKPRQGSKKLDRKGMDRSQIKHLPHGSINDYYVQVSVIESWIGGQWETFQLRTLTSISMILLFTLCLLYISNYYEFHLFSPRCGCRILKIVCVSDSFPTTHAAHNVSDTG